MRYITLSRSHHRRPRCSCITATISAVALAFAPALAHAAETPASPGLSSASNTATISDSSSSGSSTQPVVLATDGDSFYDTSDLTPKTPGVILRTAQAPVSGPLPGMKISLPPTATKLIYTTTKADGTPIAVSGYTVEPQVPWNGPGPRPTVVIGRGTVGQGDQCAPSRNWPLDNQPNPFVSDRLVALEGLYDGIFAAQGIRVVVIDYVGMGTPGVHTYMNRAEQAHAMLDAARAARNLVEGRGEAFGKVGFYGHSQGGGASAAAAEEAASYAPDVDVAGAYASAPPADLDAVQRRIDGSDLVGAIGFSINGLVARYPSLKPQLDQYLSPAGQETLERLSGMCTNEITDAYGHQKTSEWTKDGRSLDQLLENFPEGKRAMEEQRIGRRTPSAPVMIISGKYDLNVEYQQAKNLAQQWCQAGATVVYRDDILPPLADYNHFIQAASGNPFGLGFLINRFYGRPVHNVCTGFNSTRGSLEGSISGSTSPESSVALSNPGSSEH